MNKNTIEILKGRRSRYALKKESPISNEEIVKLVEDAVLYTPSAFNSQSSRVLVLFGSKHDKLWNITTDILKNLAGKNRSFESTQAKMDAFKAAYGTILFFEDQTAIEELQTKFPTYKDVFPIWSYESAGMLNLTVWLALSENGLGASLQHYNPLIDEKIKQEYNITSSWKLIAQMPFGVSTMPDSEKSFIPVNERVKVLGK